MRDLSKHSLSISPTDMDISSTSRHRREGVIATDSIDMSTLSGRESPIHISPRAAGWGSGTCYSVRTSLKCIFSILFCFMVSLLLIVDFEMYYAVGGEGIPVKIGSFVDCCPLSLGSMFRKGEGTLYDYMFGEPEGVGVVDRMENDNHLVDLVLKAAPYGGSALLSNLRADTIVRAVGTSESKDAVKISEYSLKDTDTSLLFPPDSLKLREGIEVLTTEQYMSGYLERERETHNHTGNDLILVHITGNESTFRTLDAQILEVPRILRLLVDGHSPLLAADVENHPKTIRLPTGLSENIDRSSLFDFIHTLREKRWKKTRLLHIHPGLSRTTTRSVPFALMEKFGPTSSTTNYGVEVDYFLTISRAKFVLCKDSYQVTESLIVGSIPIIESSLGLSRVYSLLPVMSLHNLSSLSVELLEDAYQCYIMYGEKFQFSRLTTEYWQTFLSSLVESSQGNIESDSLRPMYCRYDEGVSHHIEDTIIGHSFLRGDRLTSLDLIDAMHLQNGTYTIQVILFSKSMYSMTHYFIHFQWIEEKKEDEEMRSTVGSIEKEKMHIN